MKRTWLVLAVATAAVLLGTCGPVELPDLPDGGPGTQVDAGQPDAGGQDGGTADSGSPGGGLARLRIMAANLTSGNGQSYDPGHGIRLMQGVAPDIVLIQEFNYGDNSTSALQGLVQSTFGAQFSWYREGGAQIPNGVISRWPIVESGEWDDPRVSNRDFAWARIDIPGPRDLWAVSVHLLTSNATERNLEAQRLLQYIQAHVPAEDYLVVGGDLNTRSYSESCLGTLAQVVVTSAPYPADQSGNSYTNASRSEPYDHVFEDADLRAFRTAVVVGNSTFPQGLVLDSRVYTPLSEIAPAQQGDSAATGMQHMGVLKDFLVPE